LAGEAAASAVAAGAVLAAERTAVDEEMNYNCFSLVCGLEMDDEVGT